MTKTAKIILPIPLVVAKAIVTLAKIIMLYYTVLID